MYLFSEVENWELLWPHSKCVNRDHNRLLMDALSKAVHNNKMSAGCTVKCDPGMNLSNGAEDIIYLLLYVNVVR